MGSIPLPPSPSTYAPRREEKNTERHRATGRPDNQAAHHGRGGRLLPENPRDRPRHAGTTEVYPQHRSGKPLAHLRREEARIQIRDGTGQVYCGAPRNHRSLHPLTPAAPMQTVVSIPGIHCSSCVAMIREISGEFPEIQTVDVDLATKTVTLTHT